MNEGWIRLSEAAAEMNKEKSAFMRLLRKQGIPISKVYDDNDPATRGQQVSVIRREDFQRFLQNRKKPG